jgi:L-fuconolactonase
MSAMEIVDGQLHEPGPILGWEGAPAELRRQLFTELVQAMTESVGVDAVLLHPYEDPGWAEGLADQHPGRFASVVELQDPAAPDIEERVAELAGRPGVVGARVIAAVPPEQLARLAAGEFDAAFAACERHRLPAFAMVSGSPALLDPVARAHPDLQIVVEHIGTRQPPAESYWAAADDWGFSVPEDPPFRSLPDLLALARYEHVAVKLCGAPTLSTQGFPFADVWPRVEEVIAAFGVERAFWASDIGRMSGRIGLTIRVPGADRPYQGKHNYMESLRFFSDNPQLSAAEKQQLLGGTVRRLLGWQPPPATPVGDG